MTKNRDESNSPDFESKQKKVAINTNINLFAINRDWFFFVRFFVTFTLLYLSNCFFFDRLNENTTCAHGQFDTKKSQHEITGWCWLGRHCLSRSCVYCCWCCWFYFVIYGTRKKMPKKNTQIDTWYDEINAELLHFVSVNSSSEQTH